MRKDWKELEGIKKISQNVLNNLLKTISKEIKKYAKQKGWRNGIMSKELI